MPALRVTNGVTGDSLILPSDQLKVPTGGKVPTTTSIVVNVAPAASLTYTVEADDFLTTSPRRSCWSYYKMS